MDWNIFIARVPHNTPVRYFSIDTNDYHTGVILMVFDVITDLKGHPLLAPRVQMEGEKAHRNIRAEFLEYQIDGRWQEIDEVMKLKRSSSETV